MAGGRNTYELLFLFSLSPPLLNLFLCLLGGRGERSLNTVAVFLPLSSSCFLGGARKFMTAT